MLHASRCDLVLCKEYHFRACLHCPQHLLITQWRTTCGGTRQLWQCPKLQAPGDPMIIAIGPTAYTLH